MAEGTIGSQLLKDDPTTSPSLKTPQTNLPTPKPSAEAPQIGSSNASYGAATTGSAVQSSTDPGAGRFHTRLRISETGIHLMVLLRRTERLGPMAVLRPRAGVRRSLLLHPTRRRLRSYHLDRILCLCRTC